MNAVAQAKEKATLDRIDNELSTILFNVLTKEIKCPLRRYSECMANEVIQEAS